MVKFETEADGRLVIVTEHNNRRRKLKIPTSLPIVGASMGKWRVEQHPPILDCWYKTQDKDTSSKAILCSSHHQHTIKTQKMITLRSRLANKDVSWSAKPFFGAEFSHIPQYWEWLEDVLCRYRGILSTLNLLDAVYASMFLYEGHLPIMQHLCECWCPATNTIITEAGEASISLWDIHTLCGLPITGMFYDEVIPTAAELEGSNEAASYLPYSCKYLFAAFGHLNEKFGTKTITLEQWSRFWFRGPLVYSVASRKSRRPTPVKEFQDLGDHKPWSDVIHEVFNILNIPSEHRKQTYLAAFLSCWLCAFVFPLKQLGSIRPSVFKPASFLASGQQMSLAIPVLASIYKGLSELSNSKTPGEEPGFFPAHYVYAWTAKYFRSHDMMSRKFAGATMIGFHGSEALSKVSDAKVLVCSGEDINWVGNMMNTSYDEKFVDNGNLVRQTGEFFLCMRSCFLTLRFDDSYIVESYSPHRFSRQFGFCQDMPGELIPFSKKVTRESLYSLFQTSIQLGTKSSFLIPKRETNFHARVTSPYDSWWESVYSISTTSPYKRKADDMNPSESKKDPDLNKKIKPKVKLVRNSVAQSLKEPPQEVVKKVSSQDDDSAEGKESIFDHIFGSENLDDISEPDDPKDCQAETNIADELRACNNGFAPLDQDIIDAAADPVSLHVASVLMERDCYVVRDAIPISMKAPPFVARDVISSSYRRAAGFMVKEMKEKLLTTPFGEIPSLDQGFEELYQHINGLNFDISNFQSYVKNCVDLASNLLALRSTHGDPASVEEKERSLSSLESRMTDAVNLQKGKQADFKSVQAKLLDVQEKYDKLKHELLLLEEEQSKLSALILDAGDSLAKNAKIVKDLAETHTSLEKEIVELKSSKEVQKEAEKKLNVSLEALRAFDWQP